MNNNDERSLDKRLSVAVCRAFEQLIKNIKSEPDLILQGGNQPVDEEKTLTEIRSWLFGMRGKDGCTDNSPDK